jgi:hypothetical protein
MSAAAPTSTVTVLWPLPLLAALLPAAATVIAYGLSIRLGLVPECNPFLDGCVSISRSARYGLPNILFRALVLPAAVLQSICWLLSPGWLRTLGAMPDRLQQALPALGVAAGVFLVLYGTFLGTEGEGYRWMRRYGVVFYFGFTSIGMLVVSDQMMRRCGKPLERIARVTFSLCALLPLLGLVHVLLSPWLRGPSAKDALENITEWWAGAIFTAFFVVLAWAWHRTRFTLRLRSGND